MALLPFGPIDIVAVSALPVAKHVRVVRRLWRRHRRRRRRLSRRGHGRARRLTVRAAARVMPCLIGIIYSIAVLGPVDDAHVVVADAAHVLAVFIITGAAAVLHLAVVLCSVARRQRWDRARGATAWGWGWETSCLDWRYWARLRGGEAARSGRPQRWRTNVAPQAPLRRASARMPRAPVAAR